MTTARFVHALALAGLVALAAAAPARTQDDSKFDPSKLTTPPLHHVQVPRPERYVMPNGIVVFLLENHDLPRVVGTAYFKSSPLWIPEGKAGLATVTGQAMRKGGTAAHSGDWIDDRTGAIGASLGTGVSDDMGYGNFHCLTENLDEVVGLFGEVLRAPVFPEDKIELAKVALRRSIASRNDEMVNILIRVSLESVFGRDNPYARKPEYATVEAVTRGDCQKLHDQVFQPNRMVLAVYGDFRAAEMKKLLAAKLGDWKRGDAAPVPPPPVPGPSKQRLVFAPKDDVTQTGVVLAEMGFKADDPDYASMNVLGMALGEGFQSRLMNKIRTQRGLAYATGATPGADYVKPGVFLAYTLTRNDSVLTALDLLRKEVVRVTDEPFTADELKTAKESVQNGLIFEFAEPTSVLFRSAYYELCGYPLDFLDRYQKALESVDANSVFGAAKRKIHPDQLVAIVVGKEKEFEKPLDAVGLTVERADITIPPPPSKLAVGKASPEALAKGKALLAKAAEHAGGSAAWKAIKSVSLDEERTLSIQGQSMQMTTSMSWRLPDRYLSVNKLPMGEIKQGYDGTMGWQAAMGQIQDQPRAGEQMKKEFERSLFKLFSEPGGYEVQALDEPKTVEGTAYTVAVVKSESTKDWMLFFTADGALARMEYMGEGMGGGPAKVTTIFGDWKPVGAIQYPHSEKVLMDDKPMMDAKVTSMKLNPELADAIFAKPTQ
jgi:zinc protease